MLKDEFGAIIDKNMIANKAQYIRGVSRYIDRNSNIFYTMDFSKRNSFSDSDRAVLYDAIGVDPNKAKASVAKVKCFTNIYRTTANVFYCMTILAMSALIRAKDEKTAILAANYMTLNMYTILNFSYFKYGANKNIMDFTIANLDNSYKVRNMSSLFEWINDNTETWYAKYKDRIIRCEDTDIKWVVDAIQDRINGKLRKIANAYYKNHESGNYLNYDSDSIDQDDYHIMDNDSYAIDRLSTKVYLKLINHRFDSRFIKYAITRSDTSYTKLANLIDDVLTDDEDSEVRKVVSALIEYYVLSSKKPPDTIGKGEFVSYMKSAYASNTTIPQLEYVKKTIDKWLDENMYKYGRSKYANTAKLQYRKSFYMFLIFVINYEAKTNS